MPCAEFEDLGAVTVNIGTIEGGVQPNIVPDRASMTIDVRTVPGFDASFIEETVQKLGLLNVTLERELDLPGVWSPPGSRVVARAVDAIGRVGRRPGSVRGASYFTDASVLMQGAPFESTIVLGPGDPALAHAVDETCSVDAVEEAVELYARLMDEWCTREPTSNQDLVHAAS